MRKLLPLALIAGLAPAHQRAWAKPAPDDEEEIEEEPTSDDEEGTTEEEPEEGTKKKPGPPKPTQPDDFKKQDLTGHDMGTDKKENVFEQDRFFVDKSDTKKTAKGTLVQGSLTSTSFLYRETGGTLADDPIGNIPSNSKFSRIFTDLRLQTDFRHIGGGRWEARVDARGRAVTDQGISGNYVTGFEPVTNGGVQSGFLGQNELEVRELWLIRNGKRSDIILGRQFVPDLAAVKFDGLRIDYASSEKLTFLGFGGLYPVRGSRSVTTDYQPLLSEPSNVDGTRTAAGRFTGAGGFGAAYRTAAAYGSFGGVALVPLSSEQPRIFGTANGYWRAGPKVDFYHFAVIDFVGSNAVNAGITNLSGGANFKPDQRLRATLSFNRVDTETLNVQAQAFLADPERNVGIIQNEAYLIRIAQNQARGSLSAGLGPLQRFELTTALTFRYRNELTLVGQGGTPPPTFTIPAGKSLELYGSLTDRHSIADLRIGVDGSRIIRIGDATYQRTKALALRGSIGRELANGHGEWEAEVAYSQTQDDDAGVMCTVLTSCFGSANSNILSAGGNLYYRINRDWFAMGSAFISRTNITHFENMTSTQDPPVTGLTGFARIAYRF
jgi:hypothetical protein